VKPLAVVVARNDAGVIGHVVCALRAVAPVLVVDDASVDATSEVARAADADVVRHSRRLGRRQALRTAIAAARARAASAIVTFDDLGAVDAGAVAALVEVHLRDPRAVALTVGARDPWSPGARIVSFFASWVTGTQLGDIRAGSRLYPLAFLDSIDTSRETAAFETELVLAAAEHGWRVVEVVGAGSRRAPDSRGRARALEGPPWGTPPGSPTPWFRRSASAPARLEPLLDETAVATHLARRVARRWRSEMTMALREVAAVAQANRRRARHTAMLADAAPYLGEPGRWALAVGGALGHRVAARLVDWCRDARLRRAAVAATGIAALPLVAVLSIVAAAGGARACRLRDRVLEAVYTVQP
jgi:hypothetical protein